jgi:hypothetical protein
MITTKEEERKGMTRFLKLPIFNTDFQSYIVVIFYQVLVK